MIEMSNELFLAMLNKHLFPSGSTTIQAITAKKETELKEGEIIVGNNGGAIDVPMIAPPEIKGVTTPLNRKQRREEEKKQKRLNKPQAKKMGENGLSMEKVKQETKESIRKSSFTPEALARIEKLI